MFDQRLQKDITAKNFGGKRVVSIPCKNKFKQFQQAEKQKICRELEDQGPITQVSK